MLRHRLRDNLEKEPQIRKETEHRLSIQIARLEEAEGVPNQFFMNCTTPKEQDSVPGECELQERGRMCESIMREMWILNYQLTYI